MYQITFPFMLQPLPRQRFNRQTGHTYKDPEYMTHKKEVIRVICRELDKVIDPISYPIYIGLFIGFNGRTTADDDNIEKSLKDCLVQSKKIRNDSMKEMLGLKKRSFRMDRPLTIALIGAEYDEDDIDQMIKSFYYQAKLGYLHTNTRYQSIA